MTNRRYIINQEQLEQLEHFKAMFSMAAEQIQDFCNEERADVVYGFELGRIHSYLRQHFMDFMMLEDEIHKQEIKNGK